MTPATTSAKESAPQKRMSSTPDSMAPGMESMIALSTISHDDDAEGVGGQGDRHDGGKGQTSAQERQAGQPVPEQEGERDGERDGAPLREAERGSDDHAEDLADRTAREAVQRGAEGDGV